VKICVACYRLLPDDEEPCCGCGGEDFVPMLFVPYNDIEPYLEEKDDDSGADLP